MSDRAVLGDTMTVFLAIHSYFGHLDVVMGSGIPGVWSWARHAGIEFVYD